MVTRDKTTPGAKRDGLVAHVLRDPQGAVIDEACGTGVTAVLPQAGTYTFEVMPCATADGVRYASKSFGGRRFEPRTLATRAALDRVVRWT